MKFSNLCNKVIEYSFYCLFLLVPLAFWNDTSELFEFNKMWLTFGITILIGLAWFSRMILERRILLQRTPLDIPILLFLLSQVISTFNSLDTHVSIWGYYSRFNGGLLSIISYIFLYYAFCSNFPKRGVASAERRTKPEFACLTGVEGPHRVLAAQARTSDGGKARQDPDERATVPQATQMVKRLLYISLASGLIVSLWGLPAHFGFDPTCFVFRGNFDVSCWTDQFQPKVRIFSTLGQPNWMGTYLAILLPILIAFSFQKTQNTQNQAQLGQKNQNIRKSDNLTGWTLRVFRVFWKQIFLTALFSLFLAACLFTRSRSSFLGLAAGGVTFFILLILQETKSVFQKILVTITGVFFFLTWTLAGLKDSQVFMLVSILFLSFFILQILYTSYKSSNLLKIKRTFLVTSIIISFALLFLTQNIQFPNLSQFMSPAKNISTNVKTEPSVKKEAPSGPVLESGGTESGAIRKIVWKGAIEIWKNNPIFGTGLETYAYAYYKNRPAEHNLVSEWDYLYNKAHNEYLNYLATTGIFGLGTYLLMIGWFLFLFLKQFKNVFLCHPELARLAARLASMRAKRVSGSNQIPKFVRHDNTGFETLSLALIAGYVSILISNFLGFSIVIVNIYMFLIPAFVLILTNSLSSNKVEIKNSKSEEKVSPYQWTGIIILLSFSIYFWFTLYKFWQADRAYALGFNLDRVGQPEQAYPKLQEAVAQRSSEPVFQDELSINDAVLAVKFVYQKDLVSAEKLAQEALNFSNNVVTSHPNNVVFWKSRVRVFYTLSQVDPKYLTGAVEAIEKAHELAPTDAKVAYNLGLLYGQQGNIEKALEAFNQSTSLKPNYVDAFYAMGLYYRQAAVDKNEKVIKPEYAKKATEAMEYILKNIDPQQKGAKDSLKSWGIQN